MFNDLEVDIDHFGVSIDSGTVNFHGGVGGASGITVKSSGVQFLPGKAVNGSITDGPDADHWAVTATFQFDSSGFKAFIFNADQLTINLGSFLQLTASNFSINTGAGPSDPLVSFGSAGATINVAGLTISGSATSFAFLGDGSFRAGTGFGVTLSIGAADGSSFAWPSWLPIRIDSIGIQWPNINTDPTNFLLTLSADVTGIKGIDGLEFSGSIQGIQIDIGKLLAGEFPIVGIASIGVEVKGNLFGGQIDAELIGGIVKLDASGNMIADTDTTTPVVSRVFFAGLSGSFSMAGIGGFSIQLALSELGPLSVVIGVTLPTGITLDPDTGLTINDFVGGVQFFQTLPSLDDPMELRNLTLPTPGATPPDQWLAQVKQQVVNQYKASLAHPGQNGWAAAFTSPMLIIGSATVYSIYTSQELFNGQVTIAISTDGKFLVIGKLNFAANNLSVSGRLYADLSNISQGAATVLFLADVPDQVRVLTLYGKLQMGFKNIQGQEVAFTVPDLPPNIPTATLGGPADGATIAASELNGRGYIDVTYTVPTGQKLDDSSITDLAPEFTIAVTSGHGTVKLDSSQAPIHLTGNTYRYWVLTQGTDSTTVIALTPGDGTTSNSTWALDDTTSGTTTPNPTDASAAFSNVDSSGLRTPYIDVELAPTAGQTVDTSTLGAGDIVFTLDGSTTGPLSVSIVGSPTQIPNTSVFRYYLSGTFPDGKIDVSFPAGAWADTAMKSAAGSGSFTVVEPIASVVAPFNGPSVDVTVANGDMDLTGTGHPTTGPHYIDVVYSPPTGTSLDYSTIYTSTHPTLMIGTHADHARRADGHRDGDRPDLGRARRDGGVADAGADGQRHPLPLRLHERQLGAGHGDDHDPDLVGLGRRRRAAGHAHVRGARPDRAARPADRRLGHRRQHDQRPHLRRRPGDGAVVCAGRLDDQLGRDHLRLADRVAERPRRRVRDDRHEPGRRDRQPDADERHGALRASPARSPRPARSTPPTSPARRRSSRTSARSPAGLSRSRSTRAPRRSTCRSRSARTARRPATRSTPARSAASTSSRSAATGSARSRSTRRSRPSSSATASPSATT